MHLKLLIVLYASVCLGRSVWLGHLAELMFRILNILKVKLSLKTTSSKLLRLVR